MVYLYVWYYIIIEITNVIINLQKRKFMIYQLLKSMMKYMYDQTHSHISRGIYSKRQIVLISGGDADDFSLSFWFVLHILYSIVTNVFICKATIKTLARTRKSLQQKLPLFLCEMSVAVEQSSVRDQWLSCLVQVSNEQGINSSTTCSLTP